MARQFLKPSRPDLLVRNPLSGQVLPKDGDYVEMTNYWYRRLKCGDVVEGTPPKKAKEAV